MREGNRCKKYLHYFFLRKISKIISYINNYVLKIYLKSHNFLIFAGIFKSMFFTATRHSYFP